MFISIWGTKPLTVVTKRAFFFDGICIFSPFLVLCFLESFAVVSYEQYSIKDRKAGRKICPVLCWILEICMHKYSILLNKVNI